VDHQHGAELVEVGRAKAVGPGRLDLDLDRAAAEAVHVGQELADPVGEYLVQERAALLVDLLPVLADLADETPGVLIGLQ
jgi:hypothetical protein